MKKTFSSGYAIENIAIVETHFVRKDSNVQLSLPNHNISITNTIDKETNTITCLLQLDYQDESNSCEAKIKVEGVFKQMEESKLTLDSFAKINAPSILFPYLREHLASLSLKASMPIIVLEPVNFILFAEEKQAETDTNQDPS